MKHPSRLQPLKKRPGRARFYHSLLHMCRVRASGDRNNITAIDRRSLYENFEEVFVPGQHFADLAIGRSGVVHLVCRNSHSIDTQLMGGVQRAEFMVGLSYHDHALHLEDALCTVNRIISAEACVIQENVLFRNACIQTVLVHYADLVVLVLAVVTGQKQLGNGAGPVQRYACVKPVSFSKIFMKSECPPL